MQNSNGGWGDVGGARKQTQKSDVDSVLDAFNNILAANSDGILPTTTWGKKKGEYEPRGSEIASRPTRGGAYNSATSNQDESGNSWSSWGNNSWDTNSGWGNEDNNVRNYPMNNSEYQNSAYADDREYKDVNKDMDNIRPNPGINSNRPNQSDNHNDMYMDNDSQSGNWPKSKRPQSSQEINSPSESDSSTDHNSEAIEQDSVQMKISAWYGLADKNAKDIKEDSVGAGQLHRKGRAYIPVPEETVLAIQNGGIKKNRRGPERSKFRSAPNVPQNQVGKPPILKPSQKSSTSLKSDIKASIKTSVPPNQRPNTQSIPPNRTQQQIQQKPPPPLQPSQPQSSWDSSKLSWDDNSIPSQHQQPQQPQRPQQSQQSQKPQQPQQPQQSQKPQQPQQSQKPQQPQQSQKPQQPQQSQKSQDSWGSNLVNEPFWDVPSKTSPNIQNQPQSNSSPRQYANEVATTGGQYRSPRHQSPARSPRPAKSSLPYIPPEFDSTPYRRQRTPSPNRDNFNGYNNNNSEWDAGRVYEDDDQQNEYYEDSDFEERDDKFSGYGNRLRDRKDRGQLLLTINVEFEEGKTQAIKVHVNDDPLDLAKDFCDLFKVTNDMVMPALECLIKEEKEKRLGNN